jgi:hypothetical protein
MHLNERHFEEPWRNRDEGNPTRRVNRQDAPYHKETMPIQAVIHSLVPTRNLAATSSPGIPCFLAGQSSSVTMMLPSECSPSPTARILIQGELSQTQRVWSQLERSFAETEMNLDSKLPALQTCCRDAKKTSATSTSRDEGNPTQTMRTLILCERDRIRKRMTPTVHSS